MVLLQLIGKDRRVARGLEGLLRDFAGDLMMAVAVGDSANKVGEDDLRTLAAHGQHRVVEYALMAPAGKGLLLRLGEAEVHLCAP